MVLNRWVLRSFLKLSRVFADLISFGNLFQSVGPDTLKDLSTKVLHLVLGITSKCGSVEDLRLFLVAFGFVISFCKYCGPISCTHLYVRIKILKAIHCLTGSQCKCSRAWVVLSYLDLLNTKHAHMFCILCNFAIDVSGSP